MCLSMTYEVYLRHEGLREFEIKNRRLAKFLAAGILNFASQRPTYEVYRRLTKSISATPGTSSV